MQGVFASSTALKYLGKVKLTNTLQHIQVYKSQENQTSESSRKLWKAYIHFPYDLIKLHTLEKFVSLGNQFICMSAFYPAQSSRCRQRPLWVGAAPLEKARGLREHGWVPPRAQSRSTLSCPVLSCPTTPPPHPHSPSIPPRAPRQNSQRGVH